MQVVQKSPIIQELRQEWVEEGKREATLKGLHQILTIRFDVALGELDERFESLDLKSLEQLNETALTVQTLAEFEGALADILSKLETW